MNEFKTKLINSIIANLNNNYEIHQDNWFVSHNYFLRQNKSPENFRDRLIQNRISKYYTSKNSVENALSRIFELEKDISYYEYLFFELNNKESENKLIEVLTFRILGPRYFRFSLENSTYNQYHSELNKLKCENQYIDVNYNNWRLHLYKFFFNDKEIKCYFTTMGIVTIFKMEQYAYQSENIKIEDGDVIIDGGGCWGDTALYFANKAKNTKVYAFEFVPSNIELFNKNIALNPNANIELVKLALSGESGKSYNLIDDGASSSVTEQETDNSISINTISIDDFVQQNNINKIDFIKLDIEGAELETLNGALNTIKKYKPKLAVALYHNPVDFYEIPNFIKKLDLGYRLYLNHFTPNIAETILFAKAD